MLRRALITLFISSLGLPAAAQSSSSGNQPPPQAAPQSDRSHQQRPLFLVGKVILEDGTAPTEQVRIDLMCSGRVVRQEFTAPGGGFAFEVGTPQSARTATVSMDASLGEPPPGSPGVTSGSYSNPGFTGSLADFSGFGAAASLGGEVDLTGCELRAVAAGFRSEVLMLGHRLALDNPNVGQLILRRLGKIPGTTVSVGTLQAPHQARQALRRAEKALGKKKPDLKKARRELEKSVRIYPGFAAAWYLLGETRLASHDRQGAKAAFLRSVQADQNFIRPALALATLHFRQQEWRGTLRWSHRTLELDPYSARARYFHAVSTFFLGDVVASEHSLEELEKLGGLERYPPSCYLLGVILARRGEMGPAAGQFRRFLKVAGKSALAVKVRKILRDWEGRGLIPKGDSPSE